MTGVRVTKAQQELCIETEVMLVLVPLQSMYFGISAPFD